MKFGFEKVVVGTESALKVQAVAGVFHRLGLEAGIVPCKADSGIGNQPIGMDAIGKGARGRVWHAKELCPHADLYIGIESGLIPQDYCWFDVACAYILTRGGHGFPAFSAYFPIPRGMAGKAMEKGNELGEVVQELAGGGEKDPMRYLSEGTVLREELISQAVHYALMPILHPDRYEV